MNRIRNFLSNMNLLDPQNKIVLCLSSLIIYTLLFFPLYILFPRICIIFSIIPIGLSSYHFGWRIGGISAILFIPFNILLLLTAGEQSLDCLDSNFWLISGFLIAISVFWGYSQELRLKLENEIEAKTILENRLQQLRSQDTLTNLPNLSFFQASINQAIARCERNKRILSILFLDINGLKKINEKFGYKQGDYILTSFPIRLKNCLRGYDLIARIGGDEFIVLLDNLPHPQVAASICDRILTSIIKPYVIDNNNIVLSINIGISVFPYDSKDTDEIIKYAEYAMYKSKREGINTYQFYSSES